MFETNADKSLKHFSVLFRTVFDFEIVFFSFFFKDLMTNRQIMEEEDTSESSPFSDELLQNSFPKFAQQVPTIYKNNQARSQLYPQNPKLSKQIIKVETFIRIIKNMIP
ncbi:hypothetical protein M0813_10462 [Anaeramoeba flamelloides]|uniref:Uncharacterized protein n=1 Tax=Anaeramoeba flamelloides TaxID=1746091 RepID=A0ABQ8X443_9EUKA|nr:hypothetical protein M0813_10462 [Anaeramoeba flamelloides]